MTSSNPYDYVKNSPEFDNIVNLGHRALPVIMKLIDEIPGSGLGDYILAIAAEQISGMDLKRGQVKPWESGDEFSNHLKSMLD